MYSSRTPLSLPLVSRQCSLTEQKHLLPSSSFFFFSQSIRCKQCTNWEFLYPTAHSVCSTSCKGRKSHSITAGSLHTQMQVEGRLPQVDPPLCYALPVLRGWEHHADEKARAFDLQKCSFELCIFDCCPLQAPEVVGTGSSSPLLSL